MTPNFTPLIDALADAPLLKMSCAACFMAAAIALRALSHLNLDFYPPSFVSGVVR